MLSDYVSLMRLDKPIGILLLLWPTLWAIWLASAGNPNYQTLMIFVTGVVLMRSAGCIFNDFADRHFDGRVKRTRHRPLASGKINSVHALLLGFCLCGLAFLCVLQCNALTIKLALLGPVLISIYPFLKRVTHLPQLGLGIAFSWGVPMAFAAETNEISISAWFLFLTCIIWPLIYDTMYAMTDKDDDEKIGIKSTAILFGDRDKVILLLLQLLFITMLIAVGIIFKLQSIYYFCLAIAILLFVYQQWLIKNRDSEKCFQAFLNNHWVGLVIFVGIVLSFMK